MLPLIRLLQIAYSIGESKKTARELSEEFEISPRRVIRDIDKLRDAGWPIVSSYSGYSISHPSPISNLALSGEEKFIIATGLQMIIDRKDPSLSKSAKRIYGKLMGEDYSEGSYHLGKSDVDGNDIKKIERLRVAVDMVKMIKFSYNRPGAEKEYERLVKPYAVFFKRHSYYLVATPHDKDIFIMYRVSRITDLALTRDTFKKIDFNLKEYLEDAFELVVSGPIEEVELLFKSQVRTYVTELVWHPRHILSINEDGSVNFKLRVSINNEILRWILSFGDDCIVLKPASLRDMVFETSKKMQETYSQINHQN